MIMVRPASACPVWLVVLFLGALMAPACAVARAADPGRAMPALEGAWKLTSLESNGESRPIEDDIRLVIKEAKVFYGDELLATVVSFPDSTPKGIDLTFQEP